jgi:hypothetical protein
MDYSYQPTNWLSILKTFASFIDISLNENNVLHIPKQIASGFARAGVPEDDFSYLIIKGKSNDNISIQRMSPMDGDSFSMFLLEVTPGNKLSIIDTDKTVYNGFETVQTIFFTAASNSRSIVVAKDAQVNAICIHFTKDWLKKHFLTPMQEIVEKRAHTKVTVQLTNVIQNDISQYIHEIFNMEKYHPLFIQSQESMFFSLVETYFRLLQKGAYTS